jgi:hypothetical protein
VPCESHCITGCGKACFGDRFVSGYDFSRAVRRRKYDGGFTGCGKSRFARVLYQGTTSVVPISLLFCHSSRPSGRGESASLRLDPTQITFFGDSSATINRSHYVDITISRPAVVSGVRTAACKPPALWLVTRRCVLRPTPSISSSSKTCFVRQGIAVSCLPASGQSIAL